MKDEDGFIRACQHDPDDEQARLVYADWLEERGEDVRAEYLRLEHQWAHLRRRFAQLRETEEPWRLGLAPVPLRLAQLREKIDRKWLWALKREIREGTGFFFLKWQEIDPQLIPFVPGVVRPHLEEVLLHIVRTHGPHRPRWQEVSLITDVIMGTYGPWASGWCFSAGEGGGGGVVSASNWCCPPHSLFRHGYLDSEVGEHVDRITRAICEWRDHVDRLAGLFAAVSIPETGSMDEVQLAIRRAIARLVTWVIELTGCEDAWYSYLERALSWLLEYLGMNPDDASRIVESAVGGRFQSWIEPPPEELAEAAEGLARLAAPHLFRGKGGE
jgi:uncharacterized protein (TIGR02996 family)